MGVNFLHGLISPFVDLKPRGTPGPPETGAARLFMRSVTSKIMPYVANALGNSFALQESLWSNAVYLWTPTTSTNGNWLGTAGIGSGSFSIVLPATTSTSQSIRRTRWANLVTTLNQVLGQRNTELLFFRGAAINQGGFFFAARCGLDTWTNGGRFFGGMHTGTGVVGADPSTTNNSIGFCIDAADNGAISFMTRGTAATTKAATGFMAVSGKGYDLYINCFANDTNVFWRIVDIDTQLEASGVATLNLPANTIMMTAGVLAGNAALTAAGAVAVACSRIYVGTDF